MAIKKMIPKNATLIKSIERKVGQCTVVLGRAMDQELAGEGFADKDVVEALINWVCLKARRAKMSYADVIKMIDDYKDLLES